MIQATIATPEWVQAAMQRLRGAAACDAILSPEWELRYFSFDASWGSHWLGCTRNGSGSQAFLTATPASVFICYLDPEFQPLGEEQVNRLHQSTPADLHELFDEPAFGTAHDAVAIGFAAIGQSLVWSSSPGLIGAHRTLLHLLMDVINPNGAHAYVEFVQAYFKNFIEGCSSAQVLARIKPFFEGQTISQEAVQRLNPEIDFARVHLELEEMGFHLS